VLPTMNAPLEVLDQYPITYSKDGLVPATTVEGRHTGKVLAIKGKYLV
jgi:hypothetical protein